ncbi:MAG: RNA polymerase sigma factor [Planctomycetota bacterium]|jgi:RNA polymerase sigma-70 factor (ECF subfamily)
MSETFEAERVCQAMAGDSQAIAELWHQNRSWLSSVILGHRPPEADLEDLLQEVALRVVGEIGRLREPGAFRGWLRSIAINISRSARRRSQVQRRVRREMPFDAEDPPDPSWEQDRRREAAGQDLKRVMDLLEGFHPDYREPLLLKSMQGWSQRQIAEALGVAETTIESRLVRARRMLRQKLRNEPLLIKDEALLFKDKDRA